MTAIATLIGAWCGSSNTAGLILVFTGKGQSLPFLVLLLLYRAVKVSALSANIWSCFTQRYKKYQHLVCGFSSTQAFCTDAPTTNVHFLREIMGFHKYQTERQQQHLPCSRQQQIPATSAMGCPDLLGVG